MSRTPKSEHTQHSPSTRHSSLDTGHSSPAVFFRLLAVEEKDVALEEAVAALREGRPAADIHTLSPASFEQVPGSPFAYWVSEDLRRKFRELPPFESECRTVKQGLATADDFRFVRAWWEVSPASTARTREQTLQSRRWVAFAKGGEYSPYYSDVHLVVNWEDSGRDIKSNLNADGNVRSNVWMLRDTERRYFFRPGLTWPLRAPRFAPMPLPMGTIFSVRGYAVLAPPSQLPPILGLGAAGTFDYVFKVMLEVWPKSLV